MYEPGTRWRHKGWAFKDVLPKFQSRQEGLGRMAPTDRRGVGRRTCSTSAGRSDPHPTPLPSLKPPGPNGLSIIDAIWNGPMGTGAGYINSD